MSDPTDQKQRAYDLLRALMKKLEASVEDNTEEIEDLTDHPDVILEDLMNEAKSILRGDVFDDYQVEFRNTITAVSPQAAFKRSMEILADQSDPDNACDDLTADEVIKVVVQNIRTGAMYSVALLSGEVKPYTS